MRTLFLFSFAAAIFAATGPAVTYSEHVAPILLTQCAGCHRPGQAAPFSLMTYGDSVKHAKLITAVTKTHYMPPWKAEPASYAYRDVRRLTDAQIETLDQWVKQGTPEGDPAKAPAPPKFPEGWQLGTPDLVVELPEGIAIPADGPDIYRNIQIKLGLPEEKWVQAIEIRPSARRVVHHVLYFADAPSSIARISQTTTEGGAGMPFTPTTVPLGGWALGAQPHLLPKGLALPLPKGNDLVFQYHFHPSGKAEVEKTFIGLYFAKQAPERTLMSVQLPVLFGLFAGVRIPPGEKKFVAKDSYVLPADVEAVSVGAHAHYIGKTMRMTATLPSGEVKTLLDIKDWDFAWQDRYFFDQFVSLPKGTRLDGEVSWDNSADNPRNPTRPPAKVTWGEESRDEMGAVGLAIVARNENDVAELRQQFQQHTRRAAAARLMSDPEFATWFRGRFGEMLRGGGGGNPFDGSNRTTGK